MGKKGIKKRRIVIVNQAANYLTVGFANAFIEKFDEVILITGSVHVQGEELDSRIKVVLINKWVEKPASKKFVSYIVAMARMWVLLMTKYRKYEVLFVSLPPMAYLLNLILPHKFSMIIWDIYPDIFKITGMREDHIIYKVWSKLNKKSFSKAHKLFTISDKMAHSLEKYIDKNKIIIQPIWSIFQDNVKIDKVYNPFIKTYGIQEKFIVQYSGNIGFTHNVEVVIEIASILDNNNDILFQIIGRGVKKDSLENKVKERNLTNCMFLPFQSDEMFPFSISAADIGVVVLDETVSTGSVPSKSYNLMSLGIPSLYIASEDSELANYVNLFNHGACFNKNEIHEMAEFILKVSKDKNLYSLLSKNSEDASNKFKRKNADILVNKYLDEKVNQ